MPSAASRDSASRTGVRLTPEPVGELDLAEPRAGGQVAAEDELAQGVQRPLGGRQRPCHPSHSPEDCVQT